MDNFHIVGWDWLYLIITFVGLLVVAKNDGKPQRNFDLTASIITSIIMILLLYGMGAFS